MLSVGEPMRNTEYSSRFSEPVLAPTIRSTPDAREAVASLLADLLNSKHENGDADRHERHYRRALRLSKLLTATFKHMIQRGLCVISDSASRRVKCSASAIS